MKKIQYTVRSVPAHVDRLLRNKAKQEGRSINDVALDALQIGLGITAEPRLHHDLDKYAGTWIEDPAFEEAIHDQDRIDEELWR